MENNIYMSVSITEYGPKCIRCRFSESINDEPIRTHEITLDKARKLMWELVLAGGKRLVDINWYDRDIVTRTAYIFLVN